MSVKCPKCGSTRVQQSQSTKKHGFLWLLIFGWWYVVWIPIKWLIGLTILLLVDWWMALIKNSQGTGYVWKSKGWFAGQKKAYYCHECSHNFKG